MPLIISNIHLPLHAGHTGLIQCVAARCGVLPADIVSVRIQRRSLDARKKRDIHYVIHAVAEMSGTAEKRALQRGDRDISHYVEPPRRPLSHGSHPPAGRIVVAGLGPAGLFAAYLLAREGYRPLVIERGKPIAARTEDVERYWRTGTLDPESNVAFGEGGAGSFSDGKLTARGKDDRAADVLALLHECGAPDSIRFDAKPHIGTDRLRCVVPALREKIETLGGEVRFMTKLTGVERNGEGLTRVYVSGPAGEEAIPCAALILAIGQGARDTVYMLERSGVSMEKKPFAAGVRIEHPQRLIDAVQFGDMAGDPLLGAAEYRLTASHDGRGVFTFCMCPGGLVVAAASEMEQVVVNGMSHFARDGENANSAIVVQVSPEDLGEGPLAGIDFCQSLERAAFVAGGGNGFAPAERVSDFLARRPPGALRSVPATYRPGVTPCDLWTLLPGFIAEGVAAGIRAFARQLPGFDMEDAVLTAVETRTSAPYRIRRGADMQSLSFPGIYPVGEGAGYAGGIVSSAVDGLRAAEAIIQR